MSNPRQRQPTTSMMPRRFPSRDTLIVWAAIVWTVLVWVVLFGGYLLLKYGL